MGFHSSSDGEIKQLGMKYECNKYDDYFKSQLDPIVPYSLPVESFIFFSFSQSSSPSRDHILA